MTRGIDRNSAFYDRVIIERKRQGKPARCGEQKNKQTKQNKKHQYNKRSYNPRTSKKQQEQIQVTPGDQQLEQVIKITEHPRINCNSNNKQNELYMYTQGCSLWSLWTYVKG